MLRVMILPESTYKIIICYCSYQNTTLFSLSLLFSIFTVIDCGLYQLANFTALLKTSSGVYLASLPYTVYSSVVVIFLQFMYMLKVQCVMFRRICWQKCNIIYI